MRVIAGKAKGRMLYAPEGLDTRPITAKIKEALFSIMQAQVPESSFLDLFAGSGSIGIEAMSRGSEEVVFVEKSRKAVDVIKKNLALCKFTEGYELYQDDVFRRLDILKANGRKFDIIYLDPPFTVDEIFLPVMEALADAKLLNNGGIVVLRTKKEKQMPEIIGRLKKFKLKSYGISNIHFYNIGKR